MKNIATANQKSKFQNRSEAFTEIHAANRGVFVKNINRSVKTNKQVCLLDPIKEGTPCLVSPEDIEISFEGL